MWPIWAAHPKIIFIYHCSNFLNEIYAPHFSNGIDNLHIWLVFVFLLFIFSVCVFGMLLFSFPLVGLISRFLYICVSHLHNAYVSCVVTTKKKIETHTHTQFRIKYLLNVNYFKCIYLCISAPFENSPNSLIVYLKMCVCSCLSTCIFVFVCLFM